MENLPRPIALVSLVITLGLGISWGLAEFDYIAIEPKLFEPLLTVFGAITAIAGFFAFSGNKSVNNTNTPSNRDLLIQAVQHNWIDDGKGGGFLQDALRDASIQVEIEGTPNKAGDSAIYKDYDLPIDLVFRDGDSRENVKHTADILHRTFKDVGKKLLILGEAGTGKTVLLLQLTETLLQEARESHTPIPVVFNLASWAENRASLNDWLKQRFKTDYGVNDKLSTELIAGDNLIYCLDGLDEVAETYRSDCLIELNKFMTATRQVVICSRIKEFEALAQPLNTKYAIEVQPLADEQFKQLLEDNIPYPKTVHKILKTLQDDIEVWREIKKSLFANILIHTYADGKPFPEHNIEGTTINKVQQLIINPYIARQLQNKKPVDTALDNALIPRYLAWIASNLHKREQTIFYIEMLQGHWLPNKKLERKFLYISTIVVGLIAGLSLGAISGLIGVMIFGLFFGILSMLNIIDLERQILFNLSKITFVIKSNWKGIAILGMMGVLSGVLSRARSAQPTSVILIAGLILGLLATLIGVMSSGVIFGLIGESTINHRADFNQGLQDSLKVSISVCLILGLVGATILGLIGLLVGALVFWLILGLVLGLYVGLFFGIALGIISIIKHITLRLLLVHQRLAPRRYDKFLEHVIERRIMRRVGGSAVFIHRYILEYFAQEWTDKYASEFEE